MKTSYNVRKMTFGSYIAEYITIPYSASLYIHIWTERPVKTALDGSNRSFGEYSFTINTSPELYYDHTVEPIQYNQDIVNIIKTVISQLGASFSIRIYHPQLAAAMPKILTASGYKLVEYQPSSQFSRKFVRFCIEKVKFNNGKIHRNTKNNKSS